MNKLALTLAAILVLGGGQGCSDDTQAADAAVKDRGAGADQAVGKDQASPDSAAPPDGPAGEGVSQPDLPPAPDADKHMQDKAIPADKGATPDKAAQVDAWASSCPGVTCKVQDDCCHCKSRNGGITWPTCAITTCKQNTCGAVYIKQPTPYCLKGHCLLTDRGTACKTDSDCYLVNNCCDCLALPKGAGPPPCVIKTCLVSTCQGLSLTAAKPSCVSGVCMLKMP